MGFWEFQSISNAEHVPAMDSSKQLEEKGEGSRRISLLHDLNPRSGQLDTQSQFQDRA